MLKKYKNYLIVLCIMVISLAIFFSCKLFLSNKKDVSKINEINNPKSFAIMVQNGDGYKEYVSEDDTWPSSDYVYSKAECVDNAGNKIDGAVTFANGKATVKTKKTVYCTLYFDEKPHTLELLREKDSQGYLSTGLQGEMYRYQASFPNSDSSEMTNWIIFGTREKCEKDGNNCTNLENMTYEDYVDKYMYRIIGITEEGQLYLLKETFLKEGEVKTFGWNYEFQISDSSGPYLCPNGICPEWNQSDLFKRINGIASGTSVGAGGYESSKADTDIFVDSEYYDYLKSGDENGGEKASEWYNLIDIHSWYYGDTTQTYYNGNQMYDIETGKAVTTHLVKDESDTFTNKPYSWINKVDAKVSLMYIHDILYAYPDGTPNNPTNIKNSWIHFQKDGYNSSKNTYDNLEWLSTRWGIDMDSSWGSVPFTFAWYVSFNGNLIEEDIQLDASLTNGGIVNKGFGARPVFYLSSKAKIVEGDGTKGSPFILG